MFESALVESSGKLKSKSRYWMLATFALNALLLAVAILVPLLRPEALPRTFLTATLTVPPPPAPAPPTPSVQVVHATRSVAPLDAMTAPTRVPKTIDRDQEPLPPALASAGVASGAMTASSNAPDGVTGSLAISTAPVVVAKQPDKPKPNRPLTISSGVAAGAILTKTTPAYPAIAKAARVSGAVVLRAVISKIGTIESLQVVSGPEMLRAAAFDAVRQWRYRPYLLNGEPLEVDTTVTVNFSFGG